MNEPTLTSGVLTSPADAMLKDAIATTLSAVASERSTLFETLLRKIEACMAEEHPGDRPWTFSTFTGTDGSMIFRGGTGRSIVIDPMGSIWRARSYEDFDTAYEIVDHQCSISALTPKYEQMIRY